MRRTFQYFFSFDSLWVYLVWFSFSKGYGLVGGSEEKGDRSRRVSWVMLTSNYTYRVFSNMRASDFNRKALIDTIFIFSCGCFYCGCDAVWIRR